nr:hypothetical protein 8 [Gammaproteobacteria bacterium]
MKRIWILFLVILPNFAGASKEGMLPLTSFKIESVGLDSSGPVVIFGKSNNYKIIQLTVEAFGENFQVSQEIISELGEMYTNGISISFESGYKVAGGRAIYVTFSKSYVASEKQRITLIIQENGNLKVRNQLTKAST